MPFIPRHNLLSSYITLPELFWTGSWNRKRVLSGNARENWNGTWSFGNSPVISEFGQTCPGYLCEMLTSGEAG